MTVTDVELRFMGTGTSAGVPVIGCECATCTSSDPRDRRLRCGACLRFRDVEGADRVLLIDVPPDHREQSLRIGLKRCDGILVTHAHVDHVFGLDEVRRYNTLMGAPIGVHAEPSVRDELHRVFKHIFSSHRNVNTSYVADLFDVPLHPGVAFVLHGLRIEPLRLLHGKLPILGFRIEAAAADGTALADQPDPFPMAWCSDVSAIPPETWPRLRGLRTLALDMLRDRAHATHFTVDEAVDAAHRIDAESTWFIHMTHDLRHAELEARLPAGMAPAWDGLALPKTAPSRPDLG
jgi:phosphoribosyl 1,2-cyclic phosphate phosphodiesterase